MLPSWPSYCSIPTNINIHNNNNATTASPWTISISETVVLWPLLRGGGGDDEGDEQNQSQRERRHHPHPHPHQDDLNVHRHRNMNNDPRHTAYTNIHHSSQSPGRILNQIFCPDTNNDTASRPSSTDITARFLAGTLAFYTTAFSLQYVQYKLLKISTGTQPGIIPVGFGMITVALGSWVGHLAGLGVVASYSTSNYSSSSSFMQGATIGFDNGMESIRNSIRQLPEIAGTGYKCAREMMRPMMFGLSGNSNNNNNNHSLSGRERKERREAWMHAARICILGLITYKTIFRSHFSSLSPSSYTARGSFARIGLPAPPNYNYATPAQRAQLERIGRWWGCHTCGSRRIFSNAGKNALFGNGATSSSSLPKFHGDHIPPVSVAKQINNQWHRRALGWKVKQRFYPQCRICSNKQGGLLSRAVSAGHRNLHAVGGGEESFFHGRRLRVGHLTGGVIAVLSIGSTTADGRRDEAALVKASRERMRSFQVWFEDVGRNFKERYLSSWNGR